VKGVVTISDSKELKKYSYSKLDLFDQCKYKFLLKYIKGNYSDASTLALELGTLVHKGEEIRGRYLINNQPINFEYIADVLVNGVTEVTDKGDEYINGVEQLKKKYYVEYYTKCKKSGKTYDEKLELYFDYLVRKSDMGDWRILAVEQKFEFEYEGRCILHGFIDRIDINSKGEIRVVDYKSSNAIYDDSKLKTPLQMVIYALACQQMYGKLPVEFIYDFIFIGTEQQACSKGYLNRGIKKLNTLLDAINECEKTGEYVPNPIPLCFWCTYASHTPNADITMKHLCDYHSLWTPTNKTFAKKNEYGGVNKSYTFGFPASNGINNGVGMDISKNPFTKR
jgi:RecB family exonuclease